LAVVWGLSVQRQRVERQAEAALREGRARDAVVALMDQASNLRQQGLWTEARAVLGQAARRLDEAGAGDLRARHRQARDDLELAARLESNGIGRTNRFVGKDHYERVANSYAAAFKNAGLVPEDEEATAARIRGSAIREQLLAALDDWALVTTEPAAQARLLRIARLADPDPGCRDRVRDPAVRSDRRALEQLAAELLETSGRDQPPQLFLTLAALLKEVKGDPEPLLRAAQRRRPADFWLNFALALVLSEDKPQESVGFCRAALVMRPRASYLYHNLAIALENADAREEAIDVMRTAVELDPKVPTARENLIRLEITNADTLEEVMTVFRRAVELDPRNPTTHSNLAGAGVTSGRGPRDDGLQRPTISRLIELNPDEHSVWNYGAVIWAQSGDRGGYRDHCRLMLERFGRTGDRFIAERTAKACLLLPLGGPEQEEACELADRAVALAQDDWVLPWAEASKALADYRRGRFEDASALADKVLAVAEVEKHWNCGLPARLVKSMARLRLGHLDEARKTFAVAAEIYRTRVANPGRTTRGGDWHDRVICQVLHREVEALFLDRDFPADPFAR
jgi:serine/threonine-protein kinase